MDSAKLEPSDSSVSYGSLMSRPTVLRHGARKEDPLSPTHVTESQLLESRGSSWIGASFNLTSSIIGAGCIGLGGAIAQSGGLISLFAITVFAILSKYSFDMVIDLAIEAKGAQTISTSYEDLGQFTYGPAGKYTVILSKLVYSVGCLIAYMVIVKDNLSSALSHLMFQSPLSSASSGLQRALADPGMVTIFFCTTVMLPLCFLRDVSPLERFSTLKITAVLSIVAIVMILYWLGINDDDTVDTFGRWLQIKPGTWESLGTFVFTFVAQHAIHLVYQSVKPSHRQHFHKTTTLGTAMSSAIAILMGFFVYMTFWEETSSSMFSLYPPMKAIDICRMLLCLSMLLTYPFPFLTVRELLVLMCWSQSQVDQPSSKESTPLLSTSGSTQSLSPLQAGSDRQLRLIYHAVVTMLIFFATLVCALKATSLGLVLNLTGCISGTVISYILPAIFSYKIRGHTVLGTILFLLGGSVGIVGTYFSLVAVVK